jgi:hypothetical protein
MGSTPLSPDYDRYTKRIKRETRNNISRDAENQQYSSDLHKLEARTAPSFWNKSRIGKREAARDVETHMAASRKQARTARRERRSLGRRK